LFFLLKKKKWRGKTLAAIDNGRAGEVQCRGGYHVPEPRSGKEGKRWGNGEVLGTEWGGLTLPYVVSKQGMSGMVCFFLRKRRSLEGGFVLFSSLFRMRFHRDDWWMVNSEDDFGTRLQLTWEICSFVFQVSVIFKGI
jgi:hypothetical protein